MSRIGLLVLSLLILTPRLLAACLPPRPGETSAPIAEWSALGGVAILAFTLTLRPRPLGRLRPAWVIACVLLALHPVWTVHEGHGDCGLLRMVASLLSTVVIGVLCVVSLWQARSEAPSRIEPAA